MREPSARACDTLMARRVVADAFVLLDRRSSPNLSCGLPSRRRESVAGGRLLHVLAEQPAGQQKDAEGSSKHCDVGMAVPSWQHCPHP